MVASWYLFGSLHWPIPVRCNGNVYSRKMHSTTKFAMTVLSKCVSVAPLSVDFWACLLFTSCADPQKSLSSSKTNVNTLGMSQMIRSLSGWGWLRLVMYRQQESTKHKLLNLHLESPSRTYTESWKYVEVKLACHKDSERWATSFPVKGEISQSLRAQDCSITPETSGASNFDEAFFGSLSCFYYHHKKIWKVQ